MAGLGWYAGGHDAVRPLPERSILGYSLNSGGGRVWAYGVCRSGSHVLREPVLRDQVNLGELTAFIRPDGHPNSHLWPPQILPP